MAVLLSVAGVVVLVIAWAELVHWRAARSLTRPDGGSGTEAVVVLGFHNPNGERINWLNRWRVGAALRSIDRRAARTRLVCSGGPHEASLMARYATRRGYTGEVVVEDVSRTTWENVERMIPFLEDVERIKVVSNSLHAQKARVYLRIQRPDLADRVVRAADYRFGEWAPLKPLFAVYGLLDLAKTRRNLAA